MFINFYNNMYENQSHFYEFYTDNKKKYCMNLFI